MEISAAVAPSDLAYLHDLFVDAALAAVANVGASYMRFSEEFDSIRRPPRDNEDAA